MTDRLRPLRPHRALDRHAEARAARGGDRRQPGDRRSSCSTCAARCCRSWRCRSASRWRSSRWCLLDIPSTIMSLGGIAIAIGATVDARDRDDRGGAQEARTRADPGADRRQLLIEAAKEVTPAIFFSLLIIAVAFLPVFALTGQAGRLFKPLAYTKTFVMLISALLSITFAPALARSAHPRQDPPREETPGLAASRSGSTSRSCTWRCGGRSRRSRSACSRWSRRSRWPRGWASEFMPPLNEGDLLYMPITLPEHLDRGGQAAAPVPGPHPARLPRGRSACSARSAAPRPRPIRRRITMVETTVQLRPANEWRKRTTIAGTRAGRRAG